MYICTLLLWCVWCHREYLLQLFTPCLCIYTVIKTSTTIKIYNILSFYLVNSAKHLGAPWAAGLEFAVDSTGGWGGTAAPRLTAYGFNIVSFYNFCPCHLLRFNLTAFFINLEPFVSLFKFTTQNDSQWLSHKTINRLSTMSDPV